MPSKPKMAKRCYSFRVDFKDRKAIAALHRTNRFDNEAARKILDFFLDLCGGALPCHLAAETREIKPKRKPPKKPTKKKTAEKPPPPPALTLPVRIFPYWFTLQPESTAPKAFIIPAEEVASRFHRYWDECTQEPATDPSITILLETIALRDRNRVLMTSKPGCVWVDRRAMYRSRPPQFTPPELDWLINWYDTELIQKGDKSTSNQTMRSFYSAFFGNGKKADWHHLIRLVDSGFKHLAWDQFVAGNLASTVVAPFFAVHGVQQQSLIPDLNALFGKGGNKDGFYRLLVEFGQDFQFSENEKSSQHATNKKKRMEKAMHTLRDKAVSFARLYDTFNKATFNRLKEQFQEMIGWPYFQHLEEYCEIASLGLKRHRGFMSAFLNAQTERVKRHHDYTLMHLKPKIKAIADTLTDYRQEKKQDYLHKKQFRRWTSICSQWAKAKPDANFEEIVKAEQACCPQFGDANLFLRLAQVVQALPRPDGFFDDLAATVSNFIDYEVAHDDWATLWHPSLRPLDANSQEFPWFGHKKKSLPYGAITMLVSEPESVLTPEEQLLRPTEQQSLFAERERLSVARQCRQPHYVTLRLIGEDGRLADQKIPLYGSRAFKELLIAWDGPKVPRNDSLSKLVNNIPPNKQGLPRFDPKQASFQIYFSRDRRCGPGWYINMSVEVAPIPKVKTLVEDKHLRTANIDPGQTDAAAYSLFQRVEGPGTNIKEIVSQNHKKKGSAFFKVEKCGVLESLVDDKCVLKGKDSPPLPHEVSLWQEICRDKPVPATIVPLNLGVTSALLKLLREIVEKQRSPNPEPLAELVLQRFTGSEKMEHLVRACYDQCFGHCLVTPEGWSRRDHIGGISFQRLGTLDNMCRALRSYGDILAPRDDTGVRLVPVPAWVEQYLSILRRKLTDVRQERMNKTVNAIVRFALENGVQMVIMEDTTLHASSQNSRWHNRRLAHWRIQQLLTRLQEQCNLYGIFLKHVYSWGSSLTDFWQTDPTKAKKPRYALITKEEFGDHHAKFIQKIFQNDDLSMAEGLIREELERVAGENGFKPTYEEFVANFSCFRRYDPATGQAYVPAIGGKFFMCHKEGIPANADVIASCNLGERGIKSLYDWTLPPPAPVEEVAPETNGDVNGVHTPTVRKPRARRQVVKKAPAPKAAQPKGRGPLTKK